MNVYDFDKTIYDGDSTVDFYRYCLSRHPGIVLCLPRQLFGMLRYKIINNKTKMKEAFYYFLRKLDNVDTDLELFWDANQKKIKEWYLQQKKEDDVIISASPYFLLAEISKRLGVNSVIASEVDKHTGITTGLNCRDVEKVRRFNEIFQDAQIDNFFSDSLSDTAMAKRSKYSFIVKGETVIPWEEK